MKTYQIIWRVSNSSGTDISHYRTDWLGVLLFLCNGLQLSIFSDFILKWMAIYIYHFHFLTWLLTSNISWTFDELCLWKIYKRAGKMPECIHNRAHFAFLSNFLRKRIKSFLTYFTSIPLVALRALKILEVVLQGRHLSHVAIVENVNHPSWRLTNSNCNYIDLKMISTGDHILHVRCWCNP